MVSPTRFERTATVAAGGAGKGGGGKYFAREC